MSRKYLFFLPRAVLILIVIVLVTAFPVLNSSPSRSATTVRSFTVESGEGVSHVAHRLKEEGLIRSETFFKLICRLSRLQFSLQKGNYLIEGRLSSTAILSMMTSGKQVTVSVVIPEGYTVRQIADVLYTGKIIADRNRFIEAVHAFSLEKYGVNHTGAEGFLFPDTYVFQYNMFYNDIISVMTDNFFKKADEAGLTIDNRFYEKVILASVVEKEYRVEDEAPVIASVFLNRLKKKMRLESCATVLYVITEILGKPHPNQLFYSDLEIDSPFNTYRNAGLPPAPVSNPGTVALKAAFYPAETDYLFFVVRGDGSGRHTFTKDFYTHNYYKRHN